MLSVRSPSTVDRVLTVEPFPRVLVVYYSRTGHTEAVALGLARASDADLEAIQLVEPRPRGLLGYLRAGYEGTFHRSAAIRAPRYNPCDYDLVLVGTPTWNSALSSPVRAYLTRFADALPDVGLFVTCGARGADQVLQQITELMGKEALATLTLQTGDLRGRFSVQLAEFLERVWCTREAREVRVARARELRDRTLDPH